MIRSVPAPRNTCQSISPKRGVSCVYASPSAGAPERIGPRRKRPDAGQPGQHPVDLGAIRPGRHVGERVEQLRALPEQPALRIRRRPARSRHPAEHGRARLGRVVRQRREVALETTVTGQVRIQGRGLRDVGRGRGAVPGVRGGIGGRERPHAGSALADAEPPLARQPVRRLHALHRVDPDEVITAALAVDVHHPPDSARDVPELPRAGPVLGLVGGRGQDGPRARRAGRRGQRRGRRGPDAHHGNNRGGGSDQPARRQHHPPRPAAHDRPRPREQRAFEEEGARRGGGIAHVAVGYGIGGSQPSPWRPARSSRISPLLRAALGTAGRVPERRPLRAGGPAACGPGAPAP